MIRLQASVIALLVVAANIGAESSIQDPSSTVDTQARGYWIEPYTGLMWAGKDNGKDVTWSGAKKYCRDLRLAGYSDWRLPTIDELQAIFDRSAKAAGLGGKRYTVPLTFHVKGNLFLTGAQWSSTERVDDRGHPNGWVWYFDFYNGFRENDPTGYFTNKHALCVRQARE